MPGCGQAAPSISGVIDDWMMARRNAGGLASFLIRIGANHDGAPSSDVIEVVVESHFATSVADTLADNTGSQEGHRAQIRTTSAYVPCCVGISRRLHQ